MTRFPTMKRVLSSATFTLLACACLTGAAAAEDVLRVALRQFPGDRGNPTSGLFGPPVGLPLQAIFDGLTQLDAAGEPQPALALRWKAEDAHTWVFTLREGVSFSNGEAFDAKAVAAAVEYLLSPEGRATSIGSAFGRWEIKGAMARDAHTVAIVTGATDPILPQHIYAMRIPAPAAFAKMGRVAFAATPVGTGSFMVTKWSDARIEMKAFRGSWRAPKLDLLTFVAMLDQSSRTQALMSGAIEVATETAPEEKEALEGLGGHIYTYLKPEVEFLSFITVKESPLKDVRVRRALNYAVNKERIIHAFLADATVPASQIAHPLAVGFDPNLKPYPFDAAKARALLKESGVEKGFALPTVMVGGANNFDAIAQQIGSDLAGVGVTLDIRRTIVSKYVEYMYQGGWPSLAFFMTFNGFDVLQSYRIRSCEWTHPYFCDPEMTPLIAAAEHATTAADRQRLTRAAVAHERDNPSGIILWQLPTFDGIGPRVVGYRVVGNDVQFAGISLRK